MKPSASASSPKQVSRVSARQAGAPGEQRRQLVADLLAHGAEAAGEHVAQVGLEDELVELDAVERELLGEHAAHLPRRAGDEADARAAAGAQLAQERRGARDRLLRLGRLRTPSATSCVSVSNSVLQVRLVEIPAIDVTRRRYDGGRRLRGEQRRAARRYRIAAIFVLRRSLSSRAMSAPHIACGARARGEARAAPLDVVARARPAPPWRATLTALVMARARERPCALMNSWSKPSTGAPPYCSQSVTSLSRVMPPDSSARPARHRSFSL